MATKKTNTDGTQSQNNKTVEPEVNYDDEIDVSEYDESGGESSSTMQISSTPTDKNATAAFNNSKSSSSNGDIRYGVLYVEPNKISKININNPLCQVEEEVPLEDLCIYVDLQIECFKRDVPTAYQGIELVYGTDSDKVKIGYFMQGSEYGANNLALTTNYTNIGYNEISKGNVRSTEMFGIESIDISYDSWICPTIHIKFVDIRGIALFGAEEFSHNSVRNDGMTAMGNTDSDVAASFFSCFFKFPPPRYKMYIKGYYGEPIGYELAMSDFKASFDAKTGNFNADVTFLTYKFGLLNDLTMTSLAACVSDSNGDAGAAYWQAETASGRFRYGDQDLLRVSDIAAMYQQYQSAVEKSVQEVHDRVETLETSSSFYDGLKQLYSTYKDSVEKLVDTLISQSRNNLLTSLKTAYDANPFTLASQAVLDITAGAWENKTYNEQVEIRKKRAIYATNTKGGVYYDFATKVKRTSIPGASKLMWSLADNSLVYCKENSKFENYYTIVSSVGTTIANGLKFTTYKGAGSLTKFDGIKVKAKLTDCKVGDSAFRPFGCSGISNRLMLGKYNDGTGRCKSYPHAVFSETNSESINAAIGEQLGVDSAYNEFVKYLDDMISANTSADDSDASTRVSKLNEIKTELTGKCAVYLIQAKSVNSSDSGRVITIVNGYKNSNDVGDSPLMACVPVSYYELDFTHLSELIEECQSFKKEENESETQKEETKIIQECANQYLNFNSNLMYITKSLWAHVETFLDMCLKTRNAIMSNPRTASSLGLTENNSHLPKAYYDSANSSLKVPPFPVVTKEEEVGQNKKEVEEYLGTLAPEAQECSLIDALLRGASHYWDLVHASSDSGTGSTANTYSSVNLHTDTAIQTSLYDYLRQFFEKWMYSINATGKNTAPTDIKEEWGVDEYYEKHFLFIDTFYHNLRETDKIGVNRTNFAKACYEIFEHKNNTLMSFMTDYMKDVNTILVPSQGFMLNEVENKDNTIAYYKKIFQPIPYNHMSLPETAPYFILIYRGTPSQRLNIGNTTENEDDGFLLPLDDTITEIPVGLRDKVVGESDGYVIPAIGVTYGKQYQNYFMNINVDMNKPMANEVSIAAQYELAGVDTSDNSGGNEANIHLGQDLFTVYSNNSYTCTVDMMGCMWVQPLMYFQLNNIPLFRGTYMIQKMSHSITPGNMVTTFTGVRMSKYSSPFVNTNVVGLNSNSDAYKAAQNKAASYDNDCPYKVFDVNDTGEGGGDADVTVINTSSWLNGTFEEGLKKINGNGVSDNLSNWWDKVRGKKMKYALASIIYKEDTSTDLCIQLHAAILYNSMISIQKGSKYYREKYKWYIGNKVDADCSKRIFNYHNWNSVGNPSGNQQAVLQWLNTVTDNDRVVKLTEEIFLKSPSILINKVMSDGHKLTYHNVARIHNTYSHYEHSSSDFSTMSTFKDIVQIGWEGDPKKHGGTWFFEVTPNKSSASQQPFDFWELKQGSSNSSNTTSGNSSNDFSDRLINCIKQTFDFGNMITDGKHFDDLFNVNPNKQVDKKKQIVFVLKDGASRELVPRLVDILLNVYNQYISLILCAWYKKTSPSIGDDTNPTLITFQPSETTQSVTKIRFEYDGTLIKIQEKAFPADILKVLKKKFENLESKEASAYIQNEFVTSK